MRLTRLDVLFWAAGFLSNLTLLLILWYRRRFHRFPFFTAIIALEVVKTIILYLVQSFGSVHRYAQAYWSLTVADTLLQLCVVYEVASLVFRPGDGWAADLRGILTWLTGLSMVVALSLTLLASPPARTWVQAFNIRGNLFAAALMSELFVAMMVVSVSAGLPWRSHAGAIAQGLGGYCLFGVLIETGVAYFGVGPDVPAFVLLSLVRKLAYLGCVVYWIVNLVAEEQPARIMTGEMRAALLSVQTHIGTDLRLLRFRKIK